MISHPFAPVFDGASSLLILGSFPSVRSRAAMFYYGHPRNRFWRVLGGVYGESPPVTVQEKTAFLYARHVALWDVVSSCDITGSADSSIKNVVPNDIVSLLAHTRITRVFVNGRTAETLYDAYLLPLGAPKAVYLPSTSPANAAWDCDRLIAAWRKALSEDGA